MDERLPNQGSGSVIPESEREDGFYVLKLGDGLEFAEFEPGLWRVTVFHVLGVSRQVSLGYAEAYLLEYFLKHPGEMLSRQNLIDYAWRDRVVSQGSLNQAISNLRALLGDDQKREIILTVPRHGYQLNGDVIVSPDEWLKRKAEMLAPPPSSLEVVVEPPPPKTPDSDRRDWRSLFLFGIVGALLILLMGGVGARYFYLIFPPFEIDDFNADSLQLTLIAKNQKEIHETQELLSPLFKRMAALGGGRVIVSRTHHYLELDCLRNDGTMHSLRVHQGRILSIEDNYLQECLK